MVDGISDGDLGLLPDRAERSHAHVPFLSDQPWKTYAKRVATVGDLAEAVRDYADRLWAAGLRPGEQLAVVKENHIDVQAICAAAIRIGAVPALLSARIEPAELVQCIARLDKPALLVDRRGAAQLDAEIRAVRHYAPRIWTLDQPWGEARVLGERAAHAVARRSPSDPMVITHTSGTTGVPKLAAHSSESLFGHVAQQLALARQVGAGNDLAGKCISFVHARMCSVVVALLHMPLPLLSIADASLAGIKKTLLQYRPQALESHPNLFMLWEQLADDPERPLASVRRYLSSFDAVHPRTVRKLIHASDHPGGAAYLQAYGQTESGAVTFHFLTGADLGALRGRDVGIPFPNHTEVRVVGPDGGELPTGQVGKVEIRSPGRVLGLLGAPPLPPRDAWWPMGDLGIQRADGHLEILDRAVDHVDGVGSTLAAEDALLEALPELTEIVLLAHPSDGSAVAVASTAGDRPLDPVRWSAAAGSVGLRDVRLVQRRWEDLPMTGTWKVRRHRLRESLQPAQA